ncbi:LOW QUALITY PROTEIN: hypothetical protein U9M48_000878 [Paspalum notatum var. saurae]|uniref:DUF4219 domain-containing protein n=1 Tax=Paspalum notatum var. saurae TaxID=547442 RepID=A0AAQ3SHQ3_PASNO
MPSGGGDKSGDKTNDDTGDDTASSSPSTTRTLLGGGGATSEVVLERVVKKVGASVVYSELTKTNYHEWELVMQVNLEAQGLWEAIESGDVERREDRLALAALLRAVPTEMCPTLAVKKTAKAAWEVIRVMRMGVEREANAQKLLTQFENITFKDGERVDDFAMCISGLASNLRSLGEKVEEVRVVKKILRVLPSRYHQIAVSIETLIDLKTLSVEELVGRLRVGGSFRRPSRHRQGGQIDDGGGRLVRQAQAPSHAGDVILKR